MKTLGALCGVLCLALVITQTRANRVVDFTVFPSFINPSHPAGYLTLRCGVVRDGYTRDSDYGYYHFLGIYHKVCCQEAIAAVRPGHDAYFFKEKMRVTGHLPRHRDAPDVGFLEVTLEYPGAEQGGDYMCVLDGTDRHGFYKFMRENVTVSVYK